jgi:hypothetical protein
MRVLIYLPWVPADRAQALSAQVVRLRELLEQRGDQVRTLGRKVPGIEELPTRPPGKASAFVQGHPDDFALFQQAAAQADVAFCPWPFGVLPPDVRTLLPVPTLFGVGPLFFDQTELGHATDRYRREFRRIVNVAAGLVYETEAIRTMAEGLYDAPSERGSVGGLEAVVAMLEPKRTRPMLRQMRVTSKDQRIAWLLTHTTLREAEVTMLREMGFEVWTTKQVHRHPDFRSGAGDAAWDEGLSLPSEVLATLNTHNFYEDPFTPEVAAALNGFFGTVLLDPYPEKLFEVLKHFQGRILIRAFGREHPLNYSSYLEDERLPHVRERMHLYASRIWFTPCYDAILPIEGNFLRSRAAMLPLALPDRVLRARGSWIGGDPRIFFVCPSIRTAPRYYGQIYRDFKKEYGHLPHWITGHQGIPVKDRHVAGYVSDEEMRRLFREMQVMYYHSREPRHIHYHPLEAIVHGMPVIYMRGGLMEAFDTGSQAGACDTHDEARAKIKRVLAGDQAFIRDVQTSQDTILETFLPENVRAIWDTVFLDQILQRRPIATAPAQRTVLTQAPWHPPELPPLGDLRQLPSPLPQRLLAARAYDVAKTPAEIRAGTEVAQPAVGLLGKFARAGYMAWRCVSLCFGKAWEQGRLIPRETGIRPYLPDWVLRVWPSNRLQIDYALSPELDSIVPLRERPLRLADLPRTPTLVRDPVGWLDPRDATEPLPRLPLTLAYSRLPGEEDDAFDKLTPSVQAEVQGWLRLAQQVVFCCEEDRQAALARYELDASRTAIAPGGLLLGPVPEPASGKLPALQPGTIVAGAAPVRRENPTLLQQALAWLEQRGQPRPPVLWAVLPGTSPERQHDWNLPTTALTEAELRALLPGAARMVVTSRGGAEAARRVFLAALARVPVAVVDSPAVRAQWTQREVQWLSADDPFTLAEWLAGPVDLARVEAAYEKARTDLAQLQSRRVA